MFGIFYKQESIIEFLSVTLNFSFLHPSSLQRDVSFIGKNLPFVAVIYAACRKSITANCEKYELTTCLLQKHFFRWKGKDGTRK